MMIKTIGGKQPMCITIVKDGKTIANINCKSDSAGFVNSDKCNVQSRYDTELDTMMVRIEV